METVSIQRLEEARRLHIITACEDTDTCPGCGAGYKVGLSACEYCRRPVSFGEVITIPAETEAYYSRLYEEDFESSLQALAAKARMVRRDDGTTGFAFG